MTTSLSPLAAPDDAILVGSDWRARPHCSRGTSTLRRRISKERSSSTPLELKGKLGDSLAAPASVAAGAQSDILQALVALGYSDREAGAALKALPADVGVSDGIKLALKQLAR